MTLSHFLHSLFSDGKLGVGKVEPLDTIDFDLAEEILETFESQFRKEFPGEAPVFNTKVASWAGLLFYRACQFLLFREYNEEQIEAALPYPLEEKSTPSIHYSVDLVFRFIPELLRFAKDVSEKDPLVNHIKKWAKDWPLSSVGIEIESEINIDSIVEHPGLLRFYIDRIISREDKERVKDHRVQQEIISTAGPYPKLLEKISHLIPAEETLEVFNEQ
ncbi:MAG: hypothetical protein MPJ24_06660 [Pirellulaceae bacterium]|nr:hypothetical protein [Pirellulaceae bacterium]